MAPKTESLGRQTIEGIQAEGRRTTMTIPAGQAGNELPIHIVNETWYSTELQTTLLSKHSDPRNGETVTRLINISRSEPAHLCSKRRPITRSANSRPACRGRAWSGDEAVGGNRLRAAPAALLQAVDGLGEFSRSVNHDCLSAQP